MGLNLEEKKAIVSEMHDIAEHSQTIVAADYTGLSVVQMTELRAQARVMGVDVKIVKNTLAKRAVEGTEHECLIDSLVGPVVLIVSKDNPGAGARLVRNFSKDNEQLIPRAIAFSGEVRPGSDIGLLASMPTLDEARSKLLSVIIAPATSLARILNEPASALIRLLLAKSRQLDK